MERLNVKVFRKGLHNKTGYIHGYVSEVSGDASETYSYPMAIVVIEKKLHEVPINYLEVIENEYFLKEYENG